MKDIKQMCASLSGGRAYLAILGKDQIPFLLKGAASDLSNIFWKLFYNFMAIASARKTHRIVCPLQIDFPVAEAIWLRFKDLKIIKGFKHWNPQKKYITYQVT